MFDRILLPLDGSETAEAILGHVSRLLRLKNVQVILFRAVYAPVNAGIEYAPLLADMQSDAEKYIAGMEKKLRNESVSVRGIVRVGEEASAILDVAKENNVTLIAMASHGRTGLSRFVLGSIAEKVVRASEVPVLVVHSFTEVAIGAKRRPVDQIPITRILLPVDGSEQSLAAIMPTRAVAKFTGASVIVLGVVEPGKEGKPDGDPLIRVAMKDLASSGIQVDSVVRVGDPASEILDACSRHNVDLVVMSTHGRSGPSRWVMGSITEKVLRGLTIPVLVVRGKKQA